MIEKWLSYIEKKLKLDAQYIFKGGLWLGIGHFAAILTTLVSSYVFANFLPQDVYGQYKYTLTLGTLFTTFTLTGTGNAIIQASAKRVKGFYSFIKKTDLRYEFIISFLAAIGATYYFVQQNTSLAIGLLLIALLQPFFNNSTLATHHLLGTQQFKLSTFTQTLKILFVSSVSCIAIFVTNDVNILLASYFITNILASYLIQHLYVPRHEKIEDIQSAQSLLKYAKHTSTQGIFSGISNQLDKILIFQNLGAAELAIYTFATAIPDQYKGLTKNVELMLLSRFTKHSQRSIRDNILQKTLLYFLILVLCAILYVVISPFIFDVFFPQYKESIFLSQIYVIGIIFGIGGLPLTAIKATLSHEKLYKFNIIISLFQILSLLILLPLFGLLGAILAKVLYRCFVCVVSFVLYYKN